MGLRACNAGRSAWVLFIGGVDAVELRGCRMTPPAYPASRSFRIELFGKFRITSDGEPLALVNKARLQALLAYLILDSDNPQPRERLAFLMWPESAESQARTNLRQLLHHLRHALPPQCGLLTADHQTVQWQPGSACGVDVLEFDRAVASAGVAARSGQADAELEWLERAARLYQDDLLPAVYDEWLQAKREQYRRQAAQVFTRLASVLEQQGEFARAIPYAERLVALDELREAHHQLLIRLHQLNRDRASALRAYHQCMRTLRRELGVEPGPATRALFEQALRADNRERDLVRPADSPASLPAPARRQKGRMAAFDGLLELRGRKTSPRRDRRRTRRGKVASRRGVLRPAANQRRHRRASPLLRRARQAGLFARG